MMADLDVALEETKRRTRQDIQYSRFKAEAHL